MKLSVLITVTKESGTLSSWMLSECWYLSAFHSECMTTGQREGRSLKHWTNRELTVLVGVPEALMSRARSLVFINRGCSGATGGSFRQGFMYLNFDFFFIFTLLDSLRRSVYDIPPPHCLLVLLYSPLSSSLFIFLYCQHIILHDLFLN